MARSRRERLVCPTCGWQGVTTLGRVRLAVFGLTTATLLAWLGAGLAGLASLDTAIAGSISLALLSIGLRLVIRGERCPGCRERLT